MKNPANSVKALSDQIRVSVVQGILKVLGQENAIKITDGSITVDKLEPRGSRLSLRLTIDIYPTGPVEPQEETPPL
jgi:hypothetical protein